MQKILRVLLLVCMPLFLSCCSSSKEDELTKQLIESRSENVELQKSYDKLANAVRNDQERIRSRERDAGIAAGCDWFISVCPQSVVTNGREAIRNGYTPNLLFFWINVFAKVMVVAVFISFFTLISALIYLKFVKPSQKEVEEAMNIIDGATDKALQTSERLSLEIINRQNMIDCLKQEEADKKESLLKIANQQIEQIEERDFLLEEITRLKSLHDVLKVFD